MQATARRRPRLGIVLTEFGIPSEVWALRQAEAFTAFEPVYLARTRRAGGLDVPEGRELHLFGADQPGIARRVLRKLGLAEGARPSRATRAALRAVMMAADLDAVLCHFAWNAVAVHAALGDRLPVVAHVHGRDVTANLRWPANRRALAAALPHLARVIVVGSHQIDLLKALDPSTEPVLIPCGAPVDLFARSPIPVRAPDTPLRVISVGRVAEEKGLFETLASFEALMAEGVAAELVVVGDGPMMADLRARVAASPVRDHVRLTGRLDPQAIAAELAAAHVFVQHSLPRGGSIEGFGVTLTEAGASGLPLIATRLGGIPDQVHDGENGILVAVGDVAAQTAALARLAGDETLRQRMGGAARRVAEGYDSGLQAARLEAEILRATGLSNPLV